MNRIELLADVGLAFLIGIALPAVFVFGPSLLTR